MGRYYNLKIIAITLLTGYAINVSAQNDGKISPSPGNNPTITANATKLTYEAEVAMDDIWKYDAARTGNAHINKL